MILSEVIERGGADCTVGKEGWLWRCWRTYTWIVLLGGLGVLGELPYNIQQAEIGDPDQLLGAYNI